MVRTVPNAPARTPDSPGRIDPAPDAPFTWSALALTLVAWWRAVRASAVWNRTRRPVNEIALLASLMLFYDAGRLLGAQRAAGAYGTAAELWHWERSIGLPDERSVQALVLSFPDAVQAANLYYKYVHFPLTVAVLVWLFMHAPEHYRWARRSIIAASMSALVVYIAFPVAPPRLLTGLGMVDTAKVYGQSVYGVPGARSLSNQFASMPSLHVGWALLLAVVMISALRGRWRWLWALHPAVTLLVVIVTANHYWLDAVAGAALVLLALALTCPATLHQDQRRRAGVPASLSRMPCPGRS